MKKHDLGVIVIVLAVMGVAFLLMAVPLSFNYDPELSVRNGATYASLIGWGSIVCGLVLDCASKYPMFEK